MADGTKPNKTKIQTAIIQTIVWMYGLCVSALFPFSVCRCVHVSPSAASLCSSSSLSVLWGLPIWRTWFWPSLLDLHSRALLVPADQDRVTKGISFYCYFQTTEKVFPLIFPHINDVGVKTALMLFWGDSPAQSYASEIVSGDSVGLLQS